VIHAIAKTLSDAIALWLAYSIWITRRGSSLVDLEEACTTSGLIKTIPPFETGQSTDFPAPESS
jgi:hypothetical protein